MLGGAAVLYNGGLGPRCAEKSLRNFENEVVNQQENKC